jgi:hypothetical protein
VEEDERRLRFGLVANIPQHARRLIRRRSAVLDLADLAPPSLLPRHPRPSIRRIALHADRRIVVTVADPRTAAGWQAWFDTHLAAPGFVIVVVV